MKMLVVSSENHLNANIPGGVQVCTNEYIDLLKLVGYEIDLLPLKYSSNLWKRVKIRLGIEVYDRFDIEKVIGQLLKKIDETGVKYVALNQVNLMKFAPIIKKRYHDAVKVIVLSHGNFSGDFLHEITREKKGWLSKIRDIIRLGYSVYEESYHFIHYIDAILCLSETEKEINNWLGCPNNVFIPRMFNPQFLDWKPIPNHIGFVGTLNHPPNIIGLEMLLKELKKSYTPGLKLRIVGKPQEIGKRLAHEYDFVEYVGHLSEEELKAEASTWCMFLNPLFWYSRGATTKLAQGINWGLPVVSTRPGNRGYVWQKGSLLVAENPTHMAKLINQKMDKEILDKLSYEVKLIAQSGPTVSDLKNEITATLINNE